MKQRCIKDPGMFWLTLFGLIVLIAYTIYTRWLVVDAEQSSERQLRAYICVEAMELEKFGSTDLVQVKVQIKNAGQTPAYKVKTRLGTSVARGNAKLPEPTGYPGFQYIGPGLGSFFTAYIERILTSDEQKSVEKGINTIYVYGDVRYWDAFGKTERWMTFKAQTRSNGTDLEQRSGNIVKVSYCEDGNDAN